MSWVHINQDVFVIIMVVNLVRFNNLLIAVTHSQIGKHGPANFFKNERSSVNLDALAPKVVPTKWRWL